MKHRARHIRGALPDSATASHARVRIRNCEGDRMSNSEVALYLGIHGKLPAMTVTRRRNWEVWHMRHDERIRP
jgi:hypothetical protein